MNELERMRLILHLVTEGHKTLGRVGHTHLQKLVYLLQEAREVPFGYHFRMHYYGPYSEQLWRTLSLMSTSGIIDIKPHESGYGYNISESENPGRSKFVELFSKRGNEKRIAAYGQHGKDLLKLFGEHSESGTKYLELLATTHFVGKMLALYNERSDDKVIQRVHSLKPHFDEEEIREAIQTCSLHLVPSATRAL